jgi:hypothetical protein
MSNRTWVCLDCRKSFRRNQTASAVACAQCGRACEYVHWKLHIPSPSKRKEWEAFWTQYLFEKREIRRFQEDDSVEDVTLPLLNQRLTRRRLVAPRRRKPVGKTPNRRR